MPRKDQHRPISLDRWVRGTVNVHFRSGHVATLQLSLRGAHSVRLQADDEQGGDRIDGLDSHAGWISARSKEIVLTEWIPDPEYGWRDTSPDDRQRLMKLGMPHGILHALADLWAERTGDPAYSIAAMSALYGLATKEDVTRADWDHIATLVEGDAGPISMGRSPRPPPTSA